LSIFPPKNNFGGLAFYERVPGKSYKDKTNENFKELFHQSLPSTSFFRAKNDKMFYKQFQGK
jgi:hypothetical protein